VHHGTDRYAVKGQRVANVYLGISSALHDGANGQIARCQDVTFLPVVVVEQGDVRRAIRVVLDGGDRRRHTVLAPLKVYEPVAPLVSAADVAGGYAAVVVATARLV
jgi:hypothetical protein